MKNYKLLIQYDGTRYSGWQKQGNTANTIQEKIENIISKMTNQEIEIHGAGRTDAGVHASGQVANVKCNTSMNEIEIKKYINSYLPKDIRIIQVENVDERFHARLSAKKKHYRYTVTIGECFDVFNRLYETNLEHALNIELMKKSAEKLLGKHDFKGFCDNKRMKKSTERIIESIEIVQKEGNGIQTIDFDYVGNGFLYHMVRIITGTLIEIGSGRRLPSSIDEILEKRDREKAGYLAPAQGLKLMGVKY